MIAYCVLRIAYWMSGVRSDDPRYSRGFVRTKFLLLGNAYLQKQTEGKLIFGNQAATNHKVLIAHHEFDELRCNGEAMLTTVPLPSQISS